MEDNHVNNNTLNAGGEELLTFDELLKDSDYKSAYDKKVNDLLAKKKNEWVNEWKKQKEVEKAENERLAKLTAEEKLAEREKAINEREKALNKKSLITETKNILNENALPTCFADAIVTDDIKAEAIKEKIEILKKSFNEEIEKAVTKRLAGNTPSISNKATANNKMHSQYF